MPSNPDNLTRFLDNHLETLLKLLWNEDTPFHESRVNEQIQDMVDQFQESEDSSGPKMQLKHPLDESLLALINRVLLRGEYSDIRALSQKLLKMNSFQRDWVVKILAKALEKQNNAAEKVLRETLEDAPTMALRKQITDTIQHTSQIAAEMLYRLTVRMQPPRPTPFKRGRGRDDEA